MLYYVPATVSKTTCIGNSLSTINIGFTALDNNLQALSAWTVSSINFLSATMISVSSTLQNEIEFLSSTMISVSSNLQGQVNYLSAGVNYLSANIVNTPGTLTHAPSGGISWNALTVGRNANLVLSSNCYMRNPTNFVAGQQGNISIVSSGTSGYSVTAFDSLWRFSGSTSMNVSPNGRNLIKYYYDGTMILSQMLQY